MLRAALNYDASAQPRDCELLHLFYWALVEDVCLMLSSHECSRQGWQVRFPRTACCGSGGAP